MKIIITNQELDTSLTKLSIERLIWESWIWWHIFCERGEDEGDSKQGHHGQLQTRIIEYWLCISSLWYVEFWRRMVNLFSHHLLKVEESRNLQFLDFRLLLMTIISYQIPLRKSPKSKTVVSFSYTWKYESHLPSKWELMGRWDSVFWEGESAWTVQEELDGTQEKLKPSKTSSRNKIRVVLWPP